MGWLRFDVAYQCDEFLDRGKRRIQGHHGRAFRPESNDEAARDEVLQLRRLRFVPAGQVRHVA